VEVWAFFPTNPFAWNSKWDKLEGPLIDWWGEKLRLFLSVHQAHNCMNTKMKTKLLGIFVSLTKWCTWCFQSFFERLLLLCCCYISIMIFFYNSSL
jgi:hypothetical protein